MSASMALASGACTSRPAQVIVPYARMPEAGTQGEYAYYASSFERDGFAHGVLMATRDGRPLKIEGNPRHPASLGATDPITQASILQLWDPDRSDAPRRRLDNDPRTPGPQTVSDWSSFTGAWRERLAGLEARNGEGLAIVTGPLTSPTDRALLARLLERLPRARWHVNDPGGRVAVQRAMTTAGGRTLQPVLHLDRARCVLALGGDPFSDGPGAVRASADWAAARSSALAAGQAPARLFAAEVSPGLFGARSERRLARAPHGIDALLARIGAPWPGEGAPPGASPSREEGEFVDRVRSALLTAGRSALVVAGPSLPPRSHARVAELNHRLGAVGHTVSLIDAPDDAGAAGDIAGLTAALRAGAIDTVVIIGCNPVYDAPGDLDFAKHLRRAAFTVHAGLYVDETAVACHWHLPLSHDYERWGDARAHDGTVSLLQPAIAPLYDTLGRTELLALLDGATAPDGHALVRAHWRGRDPMPREADAFEHAWLEALRAGFLPGTGAPAVPGPEAVPRPASGDIGATRRAVPDPDAADTGPGGTLLAANFVTDTAVHDGAYANLGWLQELPRPFSKICWDNALMLGPRTAARLGLSAGDVVEARAGSHALHAPVWIEPRHAEEAATLPLGYGRRRAGRVGTGVGFDAFRLVRHGEFAPRIALTPTGRRHRFARTQHAFDQGDRRIARVVERGGRVEEPGTDHESLYPPYANPDHAWAMTIDLDACIGCNACTIACQAENNIPVVGPHEVARGREMHWIRVDRYDEGARADTIFQPVPCMHCEHAPCELVCPVGATVHDSEGLNVQVYNRCIGTRFCSNNCPYKVRRFNFLQYARSEPSAVRVLHNPDVTVRQRGVMEKCTYCLQRIARGRHHEEITGERLTDGDVVTACQAVCPTRAIRFGDLNDPASDVRRAKSSPRHYALLGELNTRPRTTYLARVEDEG